ncbi:MAG: hypothetical protein ACI4DU_04275 [Lachnospiraceae bacterium]
MGSFQQWKKDFKEAFDELINQDILGDKRTKPAFVSAKAPENLEDNEVTGEAKLLEQGEVLENPEVLEDAVIPAGDAEFFEEIEMTEDTDFLETDEEFPQFLETDEEFPEDSRFLETDEEFPEDSQFLEDSELSEDMENLKEEVFLEEQETPEEEDNLLGFFDTTVDEELEEIIRAVQEKRRQDPNHRSAIGKASKEELIALINSKSAEMNEQRTIDLQHLRREIADLEEEVVRLTPEEIEEQIREQEERKEILQSFLKRSQERVRNQQDYKENELKQNPEKNLSAEEIIEYRFHLPMEQSNPRE